MKYDPAYQDQFLPRHVHEVHGKTRNTARVRLRLRFVVPFVYTGAYLHRGQTPSERAFEYVRNFGVRVRDIEKIQLDPCRYRAGTIYFATATVSNAADRIESDDGSASQ